MPIQDLREQIARLPEQPGVYLYANAQGDTIYIGKARSLRDRVRSYLGARGQHAKTDALLDEVTSLSVILTDSVVEALALEDSLVKQRAPKYNIRLRDDKHYPYLQLTTGEDVPRVMVARSVERDGHVYAGPFLPARLARRTKDLTHRLFGIRSCNEVITGRRDRPCLEYDIKRCLAPCVADLCSPAQYARAVEDTRLFLEGRTEELGQLLEARMRGAAADERFEEAAALRDALRTVQTLEARQQKMSSVALGDRDVVGVKVGPSGAVVQVFQVRHGRVVERLEVVAEAGPDAGHVPEVLAAAMAHVYADQAPPPELHLPEWPDEHEALEEWLSASAGRKVRCVLPQRGDKRGLIDLARRNAELAYRARFDQGPGTAQYEALETLQAALRLPQLPRRIECFDISTIQGSETVASMVVCEDGRMKRSEYRRFRVARGERFLDDFAAMAQVVRRHFTRRVAHDVPLPHLIVIDGGKGQLAAAYESLEALGLAHLVAVGLAKKEELVFTRDHDQPLALDPHGPAPRLLQRIRDEAHRFAVTYHRQARTQRDLRSDLDDVPGIGLRRRKMLLTRFGSVAGVRRASLEELTAVVGPKAAAAIREHFARA